MKNRRFKWLTVATMVVTALALAQAQATVPQPETIDGATSYVYKTTSQGQLRLHVFRPARADQSPAIVFFFGGAWTSGPVTQFAPQSKHLAQRGMVAIVADYRVLTRHQTSP